MKANIETIRENAEELDKQSKFGEIIALLTDEVLIEIQEKGRDKVSELYVWRGNAWYNKKDYDNALVDYNKAIEINPNYELAFYNRGFAWIAKQDYNRAIADFNKVIEINPNSASAYVSRGSIRRALKEYNTAIVDYNNAIEIDPNYASAYYNRGLAKKENNIDFEGSKQDFEKYLELTADENDIWAKYANYYIESLNEINDNELFAIVDIISKIKSILHVEEDCITHYTSLSVLKSLILGNSKFRLSEGNFMNDPSEGREFFNFLKYKPYTSCEEGLLSESFSPKPFIGSFVTKDKCDDLNMWRFYGKEEGLEAQGCAITLHAQEFIEDINNSLPKGEEDYLKYESDINFYWVVYLEPGTTNFYLPNSKQNEELSKLMEKLRTKVKSYKAKDKTSLEKYLNSIAFLFKSDAYKNENEVRLVVKGIEFEKKYNIDLIPPRVYIELESVKNTIKQITLGPKVDKAKKWAAAFHYSYEINAPEIIISHLPYQ